MSKIDYMKLAESVGIEFHAHTGITGKINVTAAGSIPVAKIEALCEAVRQAALDAAQARIAEVGPNDYPMALVTNGFIEAVETLRKG